MRPAVTGPKKRVHSSRACAIMQGMNRAVSYAGVVLMAVGVGAAAEQADFSRYQVILDRKPFGDESARAAQALTIEQLQTSFIKDLRLCAVYENPDEGIRVGLVSIKTNPPSSFILGIDESTDDGITLVNADYDAGRALLRKGAEEYWISMGNDPAVAPGGGGAPTVFGAGVSAPGTAGDRRVSYAERLRQRREALRAPPVEPPKLSGEELTKHLQQYQMDLIRAGGQKGPPLPLQLTPEMDEQLVKEGVLPPQQEP